MYLSCVLCLFYLFLCLGVCVTCLSETTTIIQKFSEHLSDNGHALEPTETITDVCYITSTVKRTEIAQLDGWKLMAITWTYGGEGVAHWRLWFTGVQGSKNHYEEPTQRQDANLSIICARRRYFAKDTDGVGHTGHIVTIVFVEHVLP
jgi:hypothetical protein